MTHVCRALLKHWTSAPRVFSRNAPVYLSTARVISSPNIRARVHMYGHLELVTGRRGLLGPRVTPHNVK